MSKNTLLEKFKKIGFSKEQSVLEDSFIFKEGDEIVTDIPVVNIAFSGQVDGGFSSGVHIISGESKSFKSALGLNCVAAYLKKYEDAICIFYDSEFGSPIEYFKANNVDLTRVLHVPITNIEELLFDITKKIEEIEKDDHIIILIDSLGNLASKKEVTDALEEKSAEDMTRAKKMKSLFRQITPKLVIKNVPLIAIQHVYKEIGMYARFVVSGGCLFGDTKIITPNGSREIKDLNVGDKVLTMDNTYQEVSFKWDETNLDEPEPECYEIVFEDGSVVRCSYKHEFMVDDKWVEAKDLKVGYDLKTV